MTDEHTEHVYVSPKYVVNARLRFLRSGGYGYSDTDNNVWTHEAGITMDDSPIQVFTHGIQGVDDGD